MIVDSRSQIVVGLVRGRNRAAADRTVCSLGGINRAQNVIVPVMWGYSRSERRSNRERILRQILANRLSNMHDCFQH